MLTKTSFLHKYEQAIISTHPWASDDTKRAKFMEAVRMTLTTDKCPWQHQTALVTSVWKSLGGKGKPTLKALRALPEV